LKSVKETTDAVGKQEVIHVLFGYLQLWVSIMQRVCVVLYVICDLPGSTAFFSSDHLMNGTTFGKKKVTVLIFSTTFV